MRLPERAARGTLADFSARGLVILVLVMGEVPIAAGGTCIVLDAYPEARTLAAVALSQPDLGFTLTYVHSVTLTPIEETFRATQHGIVQAEMRFEEHGPGLPTATDADGVWERRDGRFVVHMARNLDAIVMRVDADQSPRLHAGERNIDLAQWGNRALRLVPRNGPCPSTP